MVDQGNLLGHAEGDEVGEAEHDEDDGEEGQGGRLGLEGAVVRQADRLAEDPDEGLVGDGHGAREEEEAQGDVKEREGGEDGGGRDERHGGRRRR